MLLDGVGCRLLDEAADGGRLLDEGHTGAEQVTQSCHGTRSRRIQAGTRAIGFKKCVNVYRMVRLMTACRQVYPNFYRMFRLLTACLQAAATSAAPGGTRAQWHQLAGIAGPARKSAAQRANSAACAP